MLAVPSARYRGAPSTRTPGSCAGTPGAFDDLSGDLEAGRLPLPVCTAEEIALDIAIRDAGRIHHDEDEMVEDLEKDYPPSRFDYDWAHLQDALFQDKDYEGLLDMRFPLSDEEAEQWFEEFSNITPRERRRGFRRWRAKPAASLRRLCQSFARTSPHISSWSATRPGVTSATR